MRSDQATVWLDYHGFFVEIILVLPLVWFLYGNVISYHKYVANYFLATLKTSLCKTTFSVRKIQKNSVQKLEHCLHSWPGSCRCGSRGAPLDPRFWGPKIEHFWALFNFFIIFLGSLRSAYYFFNMLLFHSSNWTIFQPRFARHVISHLQVFVSHILDY